MRKVKFFPHNRHITLQLSYYQIFLALSLLSTLISVWPPFRETEESLYEMSSNTNLPIRWTAPECFRTRTFSEASDVFSFGTLIWEVRASIGIKYNV